MVQAALERGARGLLRLVGPSDLLLRDRGDGRPTRQVEVYDAGPTLRYGPGREEDAYGFLSREKLDADEDWTPWEIAKEEFDEVWGPSS